MRIKVSVSRQEDLCVVEIVVYLDMHAVQLDSETVNQVVLGTRWLQGHSIDYSIVDERRPTATVVTTLTFSFPLGYYVLIRRELIHGDVTQP